MYLLLLLFLLFSSVFSEAVEDFGFDPPFEGELELLRIETFDLPNIEESRTLDCGNMRRLCFQYMKCTKECKTYLMKYKNELNVNPCIIMQMLCLNMEKEIIDKHMEYKMHEF